ncbi:hypothetical protein GIY23_02540 [Allosaccharopolyspora coralli]|uniref:PE domain-containing protein n=1 Tax=Allosaccharopolyspora coralli TaxID=2665642 RepID=A0A5Q3QAE4_9PSEU|nr:hypothetical protein [Allosaccharopolyspora coralli]QGK68579.1 hypothetical protein GIY23_02540 [Allosaccharopolyspora coralli]
MLDNSPSGAVPGSGARYVVNTAVNSGGTAQAASFSVELDQIPALIAKYEDAQQKLQSIRRQASRLSTVGAPGNDEVSKNLAQALNDMATNGPGSLLDAVTDGINRVKHQIEQLKSAQQGYQQADESATPTRT